MEIVRDLFLEGLSSHVLTKPPTRSIFQTLAPQPPGGGPAPLPSLPLHP